MHAPVLTPQMLLSAYAQGLFPMGGAARRPHALLGQSRHAGRHPAGWLSCPPAASPYRASSRFEVTTDKAFGLVLAECAAARPGREQSWINDEIRRLYGALFAGGHAHSVECWRGGKLAGGLYGVSLGAAFFGESMFSAERDASKVALVHLVEGLKAGGFTLLDTQFITAHLARFGAIEIPRADYLLLLADAIRRDAIWVSPQRA